LAKKHFRQVIARLEKLFFPELDHEVQYEEVVEGRSPRDVEADESYDLLVVAGHGERVSGFLDELPDRLRQRLAGTFTDPSVEDRKALEARVDEVLERWERDREQQGVEHVLELEAMGGLGVTGLHTCLWAASSKAIDTLFLREQDEAAGVVCDACGWLGEQGEVCPVDGRPLHHTPDIVDEMLQSVLRDSGAVHTLEDGVAPDAQPAGAPALPAAPPTAGLSGTGHADDVTRGRPAGLPPRGPALPATAGDREPDVSWRRRRSCGASTAATRAR
jgi:peptide chain release factor subunit 1